MRFEEVIGQADVKKQLVQMVEQNRLSHALLFLGREGCGALPLAIAFAQFIVCEKRNTASNAGPSLFGEAEPVSTTLPHDSCGVCPACIKANGLMHPDIHFTYPVITKKPGEKALSSDFAEDWRDFIKQFPYGNSYDWLQMIDAENKQGNISADECNEINRKLSLKSFESEYKILIIWMPEYLAKEGNKLLKIIEEPPPKTLFILVGQDEQLILPTILSRTFLLKIPSLTTKEIEAALISKQVDENRARQIAAVSEGNLREALQIVQHAGEDWLALLREWLNATLRSGPVAQLKWIDEVTKLGREKQKQFLRYFIHLLEKCIRQRLMHNTESSLISPEEQDFADRLNKLCELEGQEAIINELDKASYYIERNAHGKMLFHALTIRLYHIIKDKSLILVN